MQRKEKTKDNVDNMLEKLQNFLKTETVIGKAIVVDDITIIPLIDVTFGLGVGFNNQRDDASQGGGMGASMTPNSLLIITKSDVKVLSIKDSSSISTLLPQILDRLNFKFIKQDGNV